MLVPKLVPEGMEFRVVGALHDMGEFVKHSIDDTLDGQKLSPISGVPQAKTYLPPSINIQAKQVGLIGVELGQLSNLPVPSSYYRLHH